MNFIRIEHYHEVFWTATFAVNKLSQIIINPLNSKQKIKSFLYIFSNLALSQNLESATILSYKPVLKGAER